MASDNTLIILVYSDQMTSENRTQLNIVRLACLWYQLLFTLYFCNDTRSQSIAIPLNESGNSRCIHLKSKKCQLHYDFGGKSREVFKVVKPMAASLLHLYWPLRDCDQPYWATGQPSSTRPRFLVHATVLILEGLTDWPNKSSSWTMYVSGSCGLTFEPRFADIRLIRMLRYYWQLSSSLNKAITF